MAIDDLPGDRQPQAGPVILAGMGFIHFVKTFPDQRQVLRRNPGARIGDGQNHLLLILRQGNGNFSLRRRILERIVKQDQQ